MPEVTLLTPKGRGGVAVLRVRGSDARARVREIFRGHWPRPGGISHGRFAEIDDGVVTDFGDEIEIGLHGNPVIVDEIVERLGSPVEFVPEGDRIQQEAYSLLQRAPTLLAARVLADQAMGALSRALREGRPLLPTARFGIALAEQFPVIVLVGKPNVGKSTLFNALVRRDRVIVSPEAGTTRDPVEELVSFQGIPVRLIDTAGRGTPKDELDAEAQARAEMRVRTADLVVHVREAEEPPVGFSVINKCDQARGEGRHVSALEGEGVEELVGDILSELQLRPVHTPGEPVVFTRRQRDLLVRAAPPEDLLK
jgi:tRNA U34 5-carboxymethylaminomethyl modifying GTPase MnmE/TrmE